MYTIVACSFFSGWKTRKRDVCVFFLWISAHAPPPASVGSIPHRPLSCDACQNIVKAAVTPSQHMHPSPTGTKGQPSCFVLRWWMFSEYAGNVTLTEDFNADVDSSSNPRPIVSVVERARCSRCATITTTTTKPPARTTTTTAAAWGATDLGGC